MNNGVITYGFGREYLQNWKLKEALREVYQNFMDYGDYKEEIKRVQTRNGVVLNVTLFNTYSPKDLSFLRIGNSNKGNNLQAIGKHGEGLKMAAMIFKREDMYFEINAACNLVLPVFKDIEHLGECFAFEYTQHEFNPIMFIVSFDIVERIFEDFKSGILTPENHKVIYECKEYGKIIDRNEGQIYVGGIFVCAVTGLQHAYDFNPSHVHLDRDRAVPSAFDVNFSAGQILMQYMKHKDSKVKAVHLNYNDYQYVHTLPSHIKENITPTIVGKDVVFVATDKDEATGKETQVIISNHSVKEAIKKDSFFTKVIRKLKETLLKGLGVYELMEQFRAKHLAGYPEMEQDFDIIMQKYQSEQ